MDKIYQEQYENFIGRTFKHKDFPDIIYSFQPIKNEKVEIKIENMEIECVSYELEEVLGYIRDNVWIVND